MKKIIAIAGTGILLMMAASVAQSHTYWAKYQQHAVPEGTPVPQAYLNDDGTINCCGCHGVNAGIAELMCK